MWLEKKRAAMAVPGMQGRVVEKSEEGVNAGLQDREVPSKHPLKLLLCKGL